MTDIEQLIATPLMSEEAESRHDSTVSKTTSDGATTITILQHYCKGCEICVDVCPKEVLEMIVAVDRWEGAMVKVSNVDNCNACMLCEYECPDFAIEIHNTKKEAKKKEKKSIE